MSEFGGRLLRRMAPRDPTEPHRTSTELELLFDLCFVVAVAFASTGLHHAVEENHPGSGVVSYLTVFFAIWWAWVNFTWFASAYDNDDVAYRLLTFVQIAGCLILAAGVPPAMSDNNLTIITVGYAVMRIGTVAQWLRAAYDDPTHRRTALLYAAGILVVQTLWLSRLALPDAGGLPVFCVLALADILVPVIAERSGMTTWHSEHIAERYGLFTIIVLGESVTSATVAFQGAFAGDTEHGGLIGLAAVGLLILFAMWWIYFDIDSSEQLTSPGAAFAWGYGHYFILAAAAAVGAGLQVSVLFDLGEGELSAHLAGFAMAVPVAVFLISLWVLQVLPRSASPSTYAYPVAAVLVLITPYTGAPVHVIAAILVVLVVVSVLYPQHRATLRSLPGH